MKSLRKYADSDAFLDDIEREKLVAFNQDEVMKEAVRKVILSQLYERGVLKKSEKADPLLNMTLVYISKNPTASNESVGEHLRAFYEGVNLVQAGFAELDNYKPVPEPSHPPRNGAR